MKAQIAPGDALEVLRADYRRKVQELARLLGAVDPSVVIPGVHPGDVPCRVGQRFEAEVAKPLVAPTLELSYLALVFSEHSDEAGDPNEYRDPRDAGAVAATLDAAHLGGVGWYLRLYREPSRNEGACA